MDGSHDAMARPEKRGTFDPAAYAEELERAASNHQVGTSLWFENDHVRVFEVRLERRERGPFHVHDTTYFWTVVEPGRGRQRFPDGTFVVRDYALGETKYLGLAPQPADPRPGERGGDHTPLRHGGAEALNVDRPNRSLFVHREGPSVAVVGGSLGGLISALVLRDAGCDVRVFERSPAPLEGRGAGIVLHPVTVRYLEANRALDLERVAASARVLRYLTLQGEVLVEEKIRYLFTSYATLYAALVERLEPERYHLGSECVGLEQQPDRVVARFADGRSLAFDLVVGADGIHSTVRSLLFPEGEPVYAGYVGWRGILAERELPTRARVGLGGALTYFVARGTHVLSYPIPAGDDGRLGRLTNWVWYRNVPAGPKLDDLMRDRRGARHEMSLPPGSVRAAHVEALRAAARTSLPAAFADLVVDSPEPFVQLIVDIGVPRMAAGRVCLVGDAAFALRPHIAAGTAKAAADAHALGEAIARTGGDVREALRRWEPGQLELGRRALDRARDLGTRVQVEGTYRPGDPGVAFGLFSPGDNNFPDAAVARGGFA